MDIPFVTLTHGTAQLFPSLGFGLGTAWFNCPDNRKQVLKAAVHAALDAGFTHIDEAEMYQNEDCTGEALQEWLSKHAVPRERLHITGKVLSVDAEGGVEAVCRRSLHALGCDYFDLYLVHAPFQRDGSPFATSLPSVWRQMEALVEKRLVKAVGVSNWRVCDLQAVYEDARIKPCCNQIEAHPYLQQPVLADYCAERKITLCAYAPLAPLTKVPGGPVDAPVNAAAMAHGKTPAQILLRWCLQTGKVPITTTSRPERLEEYKGVFGFELSAGEVAAISEAGKQSLRRLYWAHCPGFNADPRLEE